MKGAAAILVMAAATGAAGWVGCFICEPYPAEPVQTLGLRRVQSDLGKAESISCSTC